MTAAPGPEDIRRVVLSNGMQALVLENHASPSVVVGGFLPGGSLRDPEGTPGVAAFVTDVMERGTERHTFAELSDALESIGADIAMGAGRHSLRFDAKCLAEDLSVVVGLLTDMLARPTLPDDQIAKVRGQRLTTLRQRFDDTRFRALRRFRRTTYGEEHPYGLDLGGTTDSVAAIEARELTSYYQRFVHPHGGAVAVVGDVDAGAAVDELEASLGAWSAGPRPDPAGDVASPPPAARPRRGTVTMAGKVQSDIVVGTASIPRTHPDWFATSVANATLGVFGLMGRLGENVRDRRGLAYYAYSRLSGGPGPGPWYAAAGVNPANVDEAVAAMLEEMERIRCEVIPADELADVKAFLTGSLPVQLETNEGLAGALTNIARYDLGLDYLQRYSDLVNEVDAEAARAAAHAHLHPEGATIAVAGPG